MAKGDSTIPWWKRNAVAMLIILIAITVFLWLFWMIGEAGYNQSVPR
jgi:uncharacterized membrane protein (DUF106 family)